MPWFYDAMDSTWLHGRTARKGSPLARASLNVRYSAEAIVKLNTAVPGSPGTTSGPQGGALGGRWTAPTAYGARRAFSRLQYSTTFSNSAHNRSS